MPGHKSRVEMEEKMLDVRNLSYEVFENGEKVTIVKDINFTVTDG